MVADGDNVEVSGHSRTPRAWLIFSCTVWGLFAAVLIFAVVGTAINVEPGQLMKWAMSINGFIAAFGTVIAFRCLARVRVLYGQLSAHRDIMP